MASETIEQDLEKFAEQWKAAWNAHDPEAMTQCFTEDADVINPFGKQAEGHEEIRALFTEEQTGVMRESTYDLSLAGSRELGPDLVALDWEGTITGIVAPDGSAAPSFEHHVFVVARKDAGGWRSAIARAFAPVPMG